MKKLLGLLAVAPLAVTACGGSANDKKTIVLYADFDTDDTTYNRIITEFESEHNVDVILETGNAYTLATKMAAEIDADNRVADGFFSKNSMVQNAYSSYFDVLSDEFIDWDGLVAGAGQENKKFAGITYKTRIVSTNENVASSTVDTMEALFAMDPTTPDTTIGMRWSGSYMAANVAAYFNAIASQEDALDGPRLTDFKANVEAQAAAAAVIETATQGSESNWNARRMLVSQAKGYVGYGITNTYYFNRIEHAQNFDDPSLQGLDSTGVATQAEWDAMEITYPDQGTGGMGAYTDFNSGSVVSGSDHGDLIEQLIAKMQQPGIQSDLWSEYEYYPANMGKYTRTDTELESDVVFNNMVGEADDFKSMNVEIGYDNLGKYWDEAVTWIESFSSMT